MQNHAIWLFMVTLGAIMAELMPIKKNKPTTNSFKLKHQVFTSNWPHFAVVAPLRYQLAINHTFIHIFLYIRKEMALMLIVILYDRPWTVLCCFEDSRKIDFSTKQRTMTLWSMDAACFEIALYRHPTKLPLKVLGSMGKRKDKKIAEHLYTENIDFSQNPLRLWHYVYARGKRKCITFIAYTYSVYIFWSIRRTCSAYLLASFDPLFFQLSIHGGNSSYIK